MQPIKEAAAEFLAGRRVAVTGVSRTAKDHGSNVVYKRMRERVRGRGRLWPRARDRGDRRRLPVHVRPDRRSRPQGHAHDPDPDRERPAPRLIGGELRAITPLVPPAAEHEVGVAITSNAGDLCVCVNADRDPVEVTVGVRPRSKGGSASAVIRPASQPGARPFAGGRSRSVGRPTRTSSHATIEFEFHMSPVRSSSRPQTGRGTLATSSRTRRATSGLAVSRRGPPTAHWRSGIVPPRQQRSS